MTKLQESARWVPILFLGACLLGLAGCKIEEHVELLPDGSGSYSFRFSVDRVLGEGISEMRSELESKGFEIVDEGSTPSESYVVAKKAFADISELDDLNGTFTVGDAGWFRKRYVLRLRLDENLTSQGIERTLTVRMPGAIERATTGQADGRSLEWACSAGGDLEVEAAGLMVPGGEVTAYALGLLFLGVAFTIGRRLIGTSGPGPAAMTCRSCGAEFPSGVVFCTYCGTKLGDDSEQVSQ